MADAQQSEADPVRRAFARHVPEVADGVVELAAVARREGRRTKVAVRSRAVDVDPVAACVGLRPPGWLRRLFGRGRPVNVPLAAVSQGRSEGRTVRFGHSEAHLRGSRIERIVADLGGERIDLVLWSDDTAVLAQRALAPAVVEKLIVAPLLGRAVAVVRDDQLAAAIGTDGENVQLASRLCGRDIELLTPAELEELQAKAAAAFRDVAGAADRLSEQLAGAGFLCLEDLAGVDPAGLAQLGGLTVEQATEIIAKARGGKAG